MNSLQRQPCWALRQSTSTLHSAPCRKTRLNSSTFPNTRKQTNMQFHYILPAKLTALQLYLMLVFSHYWAPEVIVTLQTPFVVFRLFKISHDHFLLFCCSFSHLQGAPKKSNPVGKIRYLRSCTKFFRQIYSVYRRGFRPHILQISLEYLVAFKNYNYLNWNVHFSKWTSNYTAILT